jgi:hypothetical protein
MSMPADLRRVAPWVLCGLSLGIFTLSGSLRWLLGDAAVGDHVPLLEWAVNALGFVGIPIVGAVMAARLPANSYGWIWCATGLAFVVSDAARPVVAAAGWPTWIAWVLVGWGFVTLICLLFFVFLLFPTGRLPTDRWRWVARAAVTLDVLLLVMVPLIPDPDDAATASPWVLPGAVGRFLAQAADVGVYVMLGFVLAAMAALLLRFRRSGPVERRQLTWFVYATVLNAVLLVLDSVFGVLPQNLLVTALDALGFALLPVAVGVAVLRYRLFEIDRIVSRTVSYGLLSAVLVCVYLLVVALLRPLLEPLTGSSTVAVAASTLAVAGVFNPARRRLQAAVDRRFDRSRYDADRAVEAFAARLREQVDLDQISAGLRETVAATVAPGRVAVWLRAPSRRGPES